jgi:hexosaminidase
MYEEADAPFTFFNIGGDEVPEGALTQEEHQRFIDGVLDILRRYNLQPMGWEEITHFCPVESRAVCYSWHNGEAKPLEMAEAGYPVVLASANHLYFDFAYCRHHEERGLEWGGFTDEFRTFDWEPLQHPNIIGLNAQLWAECLRSFAQVEWQLFPKMYGLAERAWNNRSALSLADYTAMVYQTLLPGLHAEGHNFHLQLAGIHTEIQDDKRIVSMNKVMQGGEIIYSLDGGGTWQTYNEPFAVALDYSGIIKARVRYLGHTSTTTWLWIE